MSRLLRLLFVVLVAYPVTLLWLGLHVRHRERLPIKGPAIIAANHNSHLDILALYALFPLLVIPRVRPAAAADYFLKNRWVAWFALHVVGIVPVVRGGAPRGHDPLGACYQALEQGQILVVFPEGTRGEPEQMSALKAGIWYLAARVPQAPVVPIFMHGLGKSMAKGVWIPLPLFVDVLIGRPLQWQDDKHAFMAQLEDSFIRLRNKAHPPPPPPQSGDALHAPGT